MKKFLFMTGLVLVSSLVFSQSSSGKGWITLFDGKSTDALRGFKMDKFPDGVWSVINGALVTMPKTQNVDLITKERFKDFELQLEWAVDTAANSGIFFHVQEKKEMVSNHGNSPNWLDNYEIQVLDDQFFKDTAAKRSAGSLYDLIAPVHKKLMPIGQFNKARLIHKAGHVEHWLNGVKVLDFEVRSPDILARTVDSKWKNNPNYHTDTEGHIMLQHHGQKVYYRDIRIKRL